MFQISIQKHKFRYFLTHNTLSMAFSYKTAPDLSLVKTGAIAQIAYDHELDLTSLKFLKPLCCLPLNNVSP
jgi:hypothetical protein